MGITWSPAATDDFLSILKKVDELFGKMIAIKVSNKIQVHPTFRVIRQSCSAKSLSSKYRSSLNP